MSRVIQTLLVIDEAQHLAADVLEQLRLLTNLETDSRKLIESAVGGAARAAATSANQPTCDS